MQQFKIHTIMEKRAANQPYVYSDIEADVLLWPKERRNQSHCRFWPLTGLWHFYAVQGPAHRCNYTFNNKTRFYLTLVNLYTSRKYHDKTARFIELFFCLFFSLNRNKIFTSLLTSAVFSTRCISQGTTNANKYPFFFPNANGFGLTPINRNIMTTRLLLRGFFPRANGVGTEHLGVSWSVWNWNVGDCFGPVGGRMGVFCASDWDLRTLDQQMNMSESLLRSFTQKPIQFTIG